MSPTFPKQDSILDSGYWNSVKPEAKLSIPLRPATWWRRVLDFARPEILKKSTGPRKPLRRTAYLDGLRGFAALLVYWGHHHLWARDSIHSEQIFENAYGYMGQRYFACLPGIRLFFSGGHFAVNLFFVISGYVLCAKPLQYIQAGEQLKLADNLASALFRRWLRLHIPIICTTFLYMTSWHAFGIWTDAEHKGSYRDEVWNWYAEFKNFTFAFRTGGETWFSYSFHVWSIPVEFRGSLIIYTALLAFSRCTKNARLWLEVVLIYYFMYIVDGWFGSLFMMGMLLCDLDLLAASDELPGIFTSLEKFKVPICYVLWVASILLGGVPSGSSDLQVLRDSPGWSYLAFMKPQAVFDFKWFFLFWAATFQMIAIPRIWWLKSFFELRFNQYLGKISFSFYLVHGPILWTLADRLYVATGWSRESHAIGAPNWINIFPMSKGGPLGLEPSFLVPHIIILPFTLWVAELTAKLVDEPSIRVTQWLYGKVMAPQTATKG